MGETMTITKKHAAIKIIILLFVSMIVISICMEANMLARKPSLDFSKIFDKEDIDDISLSIFYISPFILTTFPLGVDDLMYDNSTFRIVVNGNELEKSIILLKQMSGDDLILAKTRSTYMNVRLYYVFESKKNGKLLDVAMWGYGGEEGGIFINGIDVKENDIFYRVVIPFMPENAVEEFENYRAGIWP
jgi:hypothetical protein